MSRDCALGREFFQVSLSLYKRERITIRFLFPIVINNTFQKRIKTERFLSEKKKEGNKFQSESSTKKKKEEKRCIFFPTFHLSGHKIFAPKRPCLRARIHFAFCITPSSRSLRVPSCPLLPDISSREETNRHREREREWKKITNEEWKKGVEAVAYNFSSLSLPFFLQKSMQIAAMHVSSRESYLRGMIFGGPDLCARIPPMCLRLCWRRFIGGLPSPWVKTIPKRLSAN